MPRDKVTLECEGCNRRNYTVTKGRQAAAERFAARKFCSHCGRHTVHRETK